METSLKTGFAQIFSCCPKKSELPKIWGGCSPPRPPGPYAYAGSQEFNSFQKFTVFSNQKGFAKYVSGRGGELYHNLVIDLRKTYRNKGVGGFKIRRILSLLMKARFSLLPSYMINGLR